jgi:hypothetical protein
MPLPNEINDEILEKYFRLLPSEIAGIQNHAKNYNKLKSN